MVQAASHLCSAFQALATHNARPLNHSVDLSCLYDHQGQHGHRCWLVCKQSTAIVCKQSKAMPCSLVPYTSQSPGRQMVSEDCNSLNQTSTCWLPPAQACCCWPVQLLKALNLHVTGAAAASLLRDIGAWGPHDLPALLQSGLLPPFLGSLEVSC